MSMATNNTSTQITNAQIRALREEAAPCQCGEWSGERCSGTAPAGRRVRVEFMPDEHRSSHDAAGNRGSYPANGSQRIWVSPECAALMIQHDGEWCEVVKRDEVAS